MKLDEGQSLTGHLISLTHLLSMSRDETQMRLALKRLVQGIANIAVCDGAQVLIFSNDADVLREYALAANWGFSNEDIERLGWWFSSGLFDSFQQTRETICIQDFRRDVLGELAFRYRGHLASVMVVPIIFGQKLLGIITLCRAEIAAFQDHDRRLLKTIADWIAADLEHLQAYRQATRDRVTGFYHRQAFVDSLKVEVARSRRYQAPLSLMMMDIDGFSHLKSGIDEKIVQVVLQKVAERITSETRQTDICGRLSENGFALVQPMMREAMIVDFAGRIKNSFANVPVSVNETPLRVALSCGIAHLRLDEDDSYSLLIRADRALSAAKRLGGDRIVIDHEVG